MVPMMFSMPLAYSLPRWRRQGIGHRGIEDETGLGQEKYKLLSECAWDRVHQTIWCLLFFALTKCPPSYVVSVTVRMRRFGNGPTDNVYTNLGDQIEEAVSLLLFVKI